MKLIYYQILHARGAILLSSQSVIILHRIFRQSNAEFCRPIVPASLVIEVMMILHINIKNPSKLRSDD